MLFMRIILVIFIATISAHAGYTQEEFENLKRDKRQEIWSSVDFSTRIAYMLGAPTYYFKCQINKAWIEFYQTHKDPSGRDRSLGEDQRYDLDGSPCPGRVICLEEF